MIIQIIGLPGSGKTSLAKELVDRTNAIHLNADAVRADLSSDLDFSHEGRVEQARRLGAMARLLSSQGHLVVVDFVNPTSTTREAFGSSDFIIWMNRIDSGRFEDTNNIWERPTHFDMEILEGASVEMEADSVFSATGIHDWRKPTTLMLGRYQPWHDGHDALFNAGLERTGQVLIAVRDTQGTSNKDPLSFLTVKDIIKTSRPKALVMKLPNITNIIYGRDVGYKIEKIDLSPEVEAISATQKRAELGL